MKDFTRYHVKGVFEDNADFVQVQSKAIAPGVASNTELIAAVSGKRIRVMGWKIQTNGASAGAIAMKNGSGGSSLTGTFSPPPSTAGLTDNLEIVPSGYFETSTGTGLFCDVATTAISGTIFYITYTP